jgi:chorismate--pyruvate lyase
MMQVSCEQGFHVDLLAAHWRKPLVDEALLLEQPLMQLAYQREVHLMDGLRPQIYARTVVPVRTYEAKRQRFNGLGNQSLGEMLFNEPCLQRGPLQVACLLPGQDLFEMANERLPYRPDKLWARRSCFYLGDKNLLVNEVFLPSEKWSEK